MNKATTIAMKIVDERIRRSLPACAAPPGCGLLRVIYGKIDGEQAVA